MKLTENRPRDKKDSSPPTGLNDVSSILLAILLVASPLMIGGVHVTTAALLSFLALAGLFGTLLHPRWRATTPQPVSIPTLAMTAMAAITLLQLLPLPTFLYKLLQPQGYALLLENWQAYTTEPLPSSWHHLSTDPHRTLGAALKWLALAAIGALATEVIRDSQGRTRFFGVALIGGAIIFVVGLTQKLMGTDLILGFYQAELAPRSLATFVNTNHAGAYFGLLTLIGLCYAHDKLHRSPLLATLGLGASTFFLLVAIAHDSDGSNLAVLLGFLVLAAGLFFRSKTVQSGERKIQLRRLAIGLLLALLVGAFFLPERFTLNTDVEGSFQLDASAETRLHFMGAALKGSLDYPLLGAGAGSVERSLAPYLDWNRLGFATVPTIESEPLEWVFTYGPLVALGLLAVFLYLLVTLAPSLTHRRGRRGRVYALGLILFLGTLSFFHFPFFTLGISAVALIGINGCLYHGIHASRAVKLGFAAALLLATLSTTLLYKGPLAEGVEETLVLSDQAALEKALFRYPTDGRLLSALSIDRAAQGQQESALALARQAHILRPHPQQELLLARMLALNGEREEAARMYRRLLSEGRRSVGLGNSIRASLPRDLQEPALMALALEESSNDTIRRVLREVSEQRGSLEGINTALELIALDRTRAIGHTELIGLYRRADQVELAEIYARGLINLDLEDAQGQRPAGLAELIEILRHQDRHLEARNIALRAVDYGLLTPELARSLLALRPSGGPQEMDDADRRLFLEALREGCPSPYATRQIQRTCWEARAYALEDSGALDEAQLLLDRLDRQYDDPRPLAVFLARQRRCRDLAALQRRHGDESRFASQLARRAQECAR